jgi:subtilisin-like proprotein convertase family protein/uncharacterized protein YvpB
MKSNAVRVLTGISIVLLPLVLLTTAFFISVLTVRANSAGPGGAAISPVSTVSPQASIAAHLTSLADFNRPQFTYRLPLVASLNISSTAGLTGTQTLTSGLAITGSLAISASQILPGEQLTAAPPEPPLKRTSIPLVNFWLARTPPAPPETKLVCVAPNLPIPSGSPAGVDSGVLSDAGRFVQDVDVQLRVTHPRAGSLTARLTHQESGRSVTLFEQTGCSYPDIGAILDDEASLPARDVCFSTPAALAGIFLPQQPLGAFDNEPAAGTWTLNVSDQSWSGGGVLSQWCLRMKVGEKISPPEPPPAPILPTEALISNISGRVQKYNLDCEVRAAVDWAGFFNTPIDEDTFLNQLPRSDNPDRGFVGSVYAAWGQVPPFPYGVHAEPVAALLRQYGLPAQARRPLSYAELRTEISAGRPVFVWVIGNHSLRFQIPQYYLPFDQELTIVAPYEHTVLAIGYTPTTVTTLDGGVPYTQAIWQFLGSWSALGNMAIVYQP